MAVGQWTKLSISGRMPNDKKFFTDPVQATVLKNLLVKKYCLTYDNDFYCLCLEDYQTTLTLKMYLKNLFSIVFTFFVSKKTNKKYIYLHAFVVNYE